MKLAAVGAAVIASLSLVHREAQADDRDARSRALVDAARRDAGLNMLAIDPRLDAVARTHTNRMLEGERVYHNPHVGDEVRAAGVTWRWVGENVAAGPSVLRVHDEFMASQQHHHFLVHPAATAIGVGTDVGADGRIYVTHIYAQLVAPAAPSRPAPAVRAPPPQPRAAPVSAPKPAATIAPAAPNVLVGGAVAEGMALSAPTGVVNVHRRVPMTPLHVVAAASVGVALVAIWTRRRSSSRARRSATSRTATAMPSRRA